VKLLLDQHVSYKLIAKLADLYPASDHVRNRGLQAASDDEIWQLAKLEGFVIVTKDEDFHSRSVAHGAPPKVLWIRSGNCATELVETLLRKNFADIAKFHADPAADSWPLADEFR
jgi:predicted nuclease of predicted toxin-antitoxin system